MGSNLPVNLLTEPFERIPGKDILPWMTSWTAKDNTIGIKIMTQAQDLGPNVTLAAALSRTGTVCELEVLLGVGNNLRLEVTLRCNTEV